ncbi:C2H2-type domain-containing protein [Caenorhabditis elegans]|uniref:C2H2-type domain-containing protein n=1 Tax=Caenorhabditis elegans TaxID=6239 RepID=H2KZ21_CAEEL|nr:C2H2-type domain-containing protein [Caenorhabditis elegans]CCD65867.1 C2H2-type domain-containing protein [Caenorhabditis elegans]|eukprot:NP_001254923.1 Uncharacterized protein CELE_R144.3 [Caenorhabditis elegans]
MKSSSSWKNRPSSSSYRNPKFFGANPYQVSDLGACQSYGNQSHQPTVYDVTYIENLRKRFNSQQDERRSVRNNEKLGSETRHIHRRLKENTQPCDLSTLTCLVGCCGRSFERIEVLAFHVSYAHQDVMSAESNNLTCLLCGKKWTTRKIMHLSLAHREIGEEHNSQCMLQVESVIAPNAPKARRLVKARMAYDDNRPPGDPKYDGLDPFLESDNPEDDEYTYDT